MMLKSETYSPKAEKADIVSKAKRRTFPYEMYHDYRKLCAAYRRTEYWPSIEEKKNFDGKPEIDQK